MSVINRMLADLEQRGAPAARAAGALHSPARPRRARRDRKAMAMTVLLLPLTGVAVALWLPPGSVHLAQFAEPMARAALPALEEGARPRPMREASVAARPVPRSDPPPRDAAPAADAAAVAAAPAADAVPVAAELRAGAASARVGRAQRVALASAPPAAPATTSANGHAAPAAVSTPGVIKRASGSPAANDVGARAPRVPGAVHKEERSTAAVRAQRRYAAAREMLASGQGHAARTQLREVLALDAAHHDARDLLVAVLRHGGEDGEARELLARGVELAPARAAFATPYARLLVDAGELERAAQVLADASASGAGDAEFHALAAAIAQQRGQHDEAVAQYSRAIEARGGRQGRLWLGLGISLAANGRNDDAQRAYRAALDSGDLPVRLHDWARSRIE